MSSVRMNSIHDCKLDSEFEMRFSRRPKVFLHRSSWYMTLSKHCFTSGFSMLYVGPIAILPKTLSSFSGKGVPVGGFAPVPVSILTPYLLALA